MVEVETSCFLLTTCAVARLKTLTVDKESLVILKYPTGLTLCAFQLDNRKLRTLFQIVDQK